MQTHTVLRPVATPHPTTAGSWLADCHARCAERLDAWLGDRRDAPGLRADAATAEAIRTHLLTDLGRPAQVRAAVWQHRRQLRAATAACAVH